MLYATQADGAVPMSSTWPHNPPQALLPSKLYTETDPNSGAGTAYSTYVWVKGAQRAGF